MVVDRALECAILNGDLIEMNLTKRVRHQAHALGFDLAGIAPAFPVPRLDAYRDWLTRGCHGEMAYMARPDRVERRANPATILPDARSLICVGLNYYPGALPNGLEDDPARGRIAAYAQGTDYHALMLPRLEKLAAFVRAAAGGGLSHRAYVDTGPVLERAYAAEAGLGFIGKNTCLIHPKIGSWLFLGVILVDAALQPTTERPTANCGTCRRCLDACPTGALAAPYLLDARRCISYLTIELKGAIPRELRPLMGNWVFGCDACQAVCPWQRFAAPTPEAAFRPRNPDQAAPLLTDLAEALLETDEEAFRQRYAGTPIQRLGRARLLRNTVVALGNWRDGRALPALTRALADPAPLVRGHAAWARGGIGDPEACRALVAALGTETDPYVQDEIQAALE